MEKKLEEEVQVRQPVERIRANYKEGLTDAQVKERMEKGWSNRAVDTPEKTNEQIIKENTFTYFNLIFLVLGILLIIARSYRSLTFLPVIIINTLIGIVQEIRAKNVLAKMNMLHAPHAIAVRNGKRSQIPSEELVLDDVVLFSAGNQICADAEVTAGTVRVNESLLTGESDEIEKKKGAKLMSGSFVASGKCYARLDKVGEDSYISKLTIEAKKMDNTEQSEMIVSINKLVKCAGIAIIPIGIALFVQGFVFQNQGFSQSIVSMVAAVIGMIPEGLYLLATIAMAVSTMRLAKKEVLLHDMKSIETLARVNILCVDKTGTITENEMRVCELVDLRKQKDLEEADSMSENSDNAKTSDSDETLDSATEDSDSKKENKVNQTGEHLEDLVSDFVMAMNADNITMKTLKTHFISGTGRIPKKIFGFSSAYKYSAAVFSDGNYVLGAPEMVLREQYEEYQEQIESLAMGGKRVLLFGQYEGELDGKQLTGEVMPLGLITLANPIRKNAKKTFEYFAQQGVQIKVISGDNPITVSQIAGEAGIAGAENYIDASTIKSNQQMAAALQKYSVFGRVTPKQKRSIVHILQKMGNTVAMTGDGVNDVLALKDADCSVAMASGSEAASQVAQVVLLDSDFSKMPSVVLEGRRVVNNIQRSAGLFFVKNIFSILLSILSLVFMFSYPLEPSQISFISMFTIGIPGFFLALEPDESRIEGKFLPNVMKNAIPGGVADVLAVGALVFCGQAFHLESTGIATAATLLLAVVGFMVLYKISRPLNKLRATVLIGNMVALIVCGLSLNRLFALKAMPLECVLLFVMFSFTAESFLRYLGIIMDWCYTLPSKLRKRKHHNKMPSK